MPFGGPLNGGNAWTRLAQIARQLLVETLVVEGQKPGEKPPFPYIPDAADIGAAIRLQYEWEEVNARIDEHKYLNGEMRLAYLQEQAARIKQEMVRA